MTSLLRYKAVFLGAVLLAIGVVSASAQDLDTDHFEAVDKGVHRPDFTLATVDGDFRSIEEWDGQVLLIDFWASWCIPCRKEMPMFNALRATYRDQGFEVVGLAADEVEKVRKFLNEVQVDFPIVYGDVFDVMDLSAEYGNSFGGLPFSAFIDRDGHIRYTQKPGELTFEAAEKILKRLL